MPSRFWAGYGNPISPSHGLPLPTMPGGAIGLWVAKDYMASPRPYIRNRMLSTAVTPSLSSPGRRNFNNTSFYTNYGNSCTLSDNGVTGPDGLAEASTLTSTATSIWYLSPVNFENVGLPVPYGTYTVAVYVRWKGTGNPSFQLGEFNSSPPTYTATGSWQRFTTTFTRSTGNFWVAMKTSDSTQASALEICDFEIFAGSADLGPVVPASHLYLYKRAIGNAAPVVTNGLIDMNNANNTGYIQFPTAQTIGPFTAIWNGKVTGPGTSDVYASVLCNMAPPGNWGTFAVGPDINGRSAALLNGTNGLNLSDARAIDSNGRGISTVVVSYDGTRIGVYINGVLTDSAAATPAGQSIKDLYFCILQTTLYTGMSIGAVALYTRALSAAEAFNVTLAMEGMVLSPSDLMRVLQFEGDSVTYGTGATFNNATSYTNLVAFNASPPIRTGNRAVPGSTLSSLVSRAAATDAFIPANKKGRQYILHVYVGTNDLGLTQPYSGNGSGYVTALKAYLDARRAAGWDKIICGTIISRTDQTDGGTQYNTDRGIVNPAIRGWVGTTIDACADFAGNANIGGAASASNTTYFTADKIHPNDTGYAQMGPISTAAVNGLWSY